MLYLIDQTNYPLDLEDGLIDLSNHYSSKIQVEDFSKVSNMMGDYLNLQFILAVESQYNFFTIEMDEYSPKLIIRYSTKFMAFKAIGFLFSIQEFSSHYFPLKRSCSMQSISFMFDASRNAVPRIHTLKNLTRNLSLIGMNTLIIQEPVKFDQTTALYSNDELTEISVFAAKYGIEIVPFLILSVISNEKAAKILESRITTIHSLYMPKKIVLHYQKTDKLVEALETLNFAYLICKKLNIRCIMYSDFALAEKDLKHPEKNFSIIQREHMSSNTQTQIEGVLGLQKRFESQEIWLEACLSTGNRFWSPIESIFLGTDALMKTVRTCHVNHLITTVTVDDGAEFMWASSFPLLFYFAEHCYSSDLPSQEHVKQLLQSLANVNLDLFLTASRIDNPLNIPGQYYSNISKWLLWQDPISPLLEMNYKQNIPLLADFYSNLAIKLRNSLDISKSHELDPLIYFQCLVIVLICEILALKLPLRSILQNIHNSLKNMKDQRDERQHQIILQELQYVKVNSLASLQAKLDDICKLHRKIWQSVYKATGFEVIENRYGGLLSRISYISERVDEYLGKFLKPGALEKNNFDMSIDRLNEIKQESMEYKMNQHSFQLEDQREGLGLMEELEENGYFKEQADWFSRAISYERLFHQ